MLVLRICPFLELVDGCRGIVAHGDFHRGLLSHVSVAVANVFLS